MLSSCRSSALPSRSSDFDTALFSKGRALLECGIPMPKDTYAFCFEARRESGPRASFFIALTMSGLVWTSTSFAQTGPQPSSPTVAEPQPSAAPPAPASYPPFPPPPGSRAYPPPPAYPVYPAPPPPPAPPANSPYPPPPGDAVPTVAAVAPAANPEEAPALTFSADVGTTTVGETNATTVVLAPLLDANLMVHPAVAFDLTWGFIWAIDGQGSTGRVGNPMLSGTYRLNLPEWRLRASVGATAPLASYPLGPDGRLYAFDYNQAAGIWGLWNAWLWTPNRMAIPVGLRVDRMFGSDGSLRAELGIAPVFGVRGDASGNDTFMQFAIEGGLPVGEHFELRPRVQIVVLPSDSVDRSQMALGVRGVLKTRYGDYFGGLLVNLDKPYGIFGGLE